MKDQVRGERLKPGDFLYVPVLSAKSISMQSIEPDGTTPNEQVPATPLRREIDSIGLGSPLEDSNVNLGLYSPSTPVERNEDGFALRDAQQEAIVKNDYLSQLRSFFPGFNVDRQEDSHAHSITHENKGAVIKLSEILKKNVVRPNKFNVSIGEGGSFVIILQEPDIDILMRYNNRKKIIDEKLGKNGIKGLCIAAEEIISQLEKEQTSRNPLQPVSYEEKVVASRTKEGCCIII